MGIEIVASLIAGLASLLAGYVASNDLIQKPVRRILGIRSAPTKSYGERLSELSASLTKASRDVDSVLGELARPSYCSDSTLVQLADLKRRKGNSTPSYSFPGNRSRVGLKRYVVRHLSGLGIPLAL